MITGTKKLQELKKSIAGKYWKWHCECGQAEELNSLTFLCLGFPDRMMSPEMFHKFEEGVCTRCKKNVQLRSYYYDGRY